MPETEASFSVTGKHYLFLADYFSAFSLSSADLAEELLQNCCFFAPSLSQPANFRDIAIKLGKMIEKYCASYICAEKSIPIRKNHGDQVRKLNQAEFRANKCIQQEDRTGGCLNDALNLAQFHDWKPYRATNPRWAKHSRQHREKSGEILHRYSCPLPL
jgi:hypothetical protein